jgi:hypothetical protein
MRIEQGRYGGNNTLCYCIKNPNYPTLEEVYDELDPETRKWAESKWSIYEDTFFSDKVDLIEFIRTTYIDMACEKMPSEFSSECFDIEEVYIEGRSGGWLCIEFSLQSTAVPSYLSGGDEDNFVEMLYDNLEYYCNDAEDVVTKWFKGFEGYMLEELVYHIKALYEEENGEVENE